MRGGRTVSPKMRQYPKYHGENDHDDRKNDGDGLFHSVERLKSSKNTLPVAERTTLVATPPVPEVPHPPPTISWSTIVAVADGIPEMPAKIIFVEEPLFSV